MQQNTYKLLTHQRLNERDSRMEGLEQEHLIQTFRWYHAQFYQKILLGIHIHPDKQ